MRLNKTDAGEPSPKDILIRRALAILLLIACVPFPYYLTFMNGPWDTALLAGIWAGAASGVVALWGPRLRPVDPRLSWLRSFGVSLICWLVLIAGVAAAMTDALPSTARWAGAILAGAAGILSLIAGNRGQMLLAGPDQSAIKDELWQANKYKAGYWALIATGVAGAGVFIALSIDLVQLSAVTVAGGLALAAWISFAALQFWFEWRTDG